ncbi:MAG: S8 family peptidase [Methyloligellaceae bacterium]
MTQDRRYTGLTGLVAAVLLLAAGTAKANVVPGAAGKQASPTTIARPGLPTRQAADGRARPIRLAQRIPGGAGGRVPGGVGGRVPGGPGVIPPTFPGGAGGLNSGIVGGAIGNPPLARPPASTPPRIRRPSKKKRKVNTKTKKKVTRRKTRTRTRRAPAARTVALPRFRRNEVLALIEGADPDAAADDLARIHRLVRLESLTMELLAATAQRFRILDGRTPAAVIAAISGDPRVTLISSNFLYRPSDKKRKRKKTASTPQYALTKLAISPAHKIAKGRDVQVAVIDTGVDRAHPALDGAVAKSFNAVPKTRDSAHPHGTAVAGIIAGRGRIKGVAPQARLLAVRAFYVHRTRKVPETTSFILLRSIDWAFAQGARVFNLSFAGPEDPLVRKALSVAHVKGAILIAAAGNGGPKAPPAYPAAYESVIAVTATDARDKLYAQANRGSYLTVAAPGVDILVPFTRKRYRYSSGTSMAAAHVSGLVALMLERDPKLTMVEVQRALTSTAHDLGPRGPDPQFGAGRADAFASLKALGGNGTERTEKDAKAAVATPAKVRVNR